MKPRQTRNPKLMYQTKLEMKANTQSSAQFSSSSYKLKLANCCLELQLPAISLSLPSP